MRPLRRRRRSRSHRVISPHEGAGARRACQVEDFLRLARYQSVTLIIQAATKSPKPATSVDTTLTQVR